MSNLTLATQLVAEMVELIEDRKGYDENEGFFDYLSGCIDTRGVIVGRLGYASLLDNTEWTDC